MNLKNKKKILSISIRYFLLVLFGFCLFIFYKLFSPLTIYPVYFLLDISYNVSLDVTTIMLENIPIELIDACIAGSAYYLLLILNLSTPNLKIKKRLNLVGFTFLVFLIINILRIYLLSFLLINQSNFFDFTHEFFWYFISTILVIGIWFIAVKVYKIKDAPFYTDLKYLYKNSNLRK